MDTVGTASVPPPEVHWVAMGAGMLGGPHQIATHWNKFSQVALSRPARGSKRIHRERAARVADQLGDRQADRDCLARAPCQRWQPTFSTPEGGLRHHLAPILLTAADLRLAPWRYSVSRAFLPLLSCVVPVP